MAIICLEGPSSIGKTTLCRLLEKKYQFLVIPEVNKLFQRSDTDSLDWYLERQTERWQMAKEKSSETQHVILDGDPLQPLWYNWIFPELNLYPLEHVIDFYQKQIKADLFGYPDHYFLLTASLQELTKRKENDTTRARKSFATHLRMIEPQQALFKAMYEYQPDLIDIHTHDSLEITAALINQKAEKAAVFTGHSSLFDFETGWIRRAQLL